MSTQPSEETKHCPFCGYNDVTVEVSDEGLGRIATASCEICGAEISGMGVIEGDFSDDDLKLSAILTWNKRSEPRND